MTDYMHFDGGDGAYVVASGYLGVAGEGGEEFASGEGEEFD